MVALSTNMDRQQNGITAPLSRAAMVNVRRMGGWVGNAVRWLCHGALGGGGRAAHGGRLLCMAPRRRFCAHVRAKNAARAALRCFTPALFTYLTLDHTAVRLRRACGMRHCCAALNIAPRMAKHQPQSCAARRGGCALPLLLPATPRISAPH